MLPENLKETFNQAIDNLTRGPHHPLPLALSQRKMECRM